MPASVPAAFTVGNFAPNFAPSTLQEFANELARLLQPVAVSAPSGTTGTYIKGGTEPLTDQGPWLPDGKREFWFYDATYGHYFPSGPGPGTIQAFANYLNDPGDNWLYCDGSIRSQASYPRLFSKIAHTYAALDANGSQAADAASLQASGQFRLPDLSGRVIIGTGGSRGLPGRGLVGDIVARQNPGALLGSEAALLLDAQVTNAPFFQFVYNYKSTVTQPNAKIYGGFNWDPNAPAGSGATAANVPLFQPSITFHYQIRF